MTALISKKKRKSKWRWTIIILAFVLSGICLMVLAFFTLRDSMADVQWVKDCDGLTYSQGYLFAGSVFAGSRPVAHAGVTIFSLTRRQTQINRHEVCYAPLITDKHIMTDNNGEFFTNYIFIAPDDSVAIRITAEGCEDYEKPLSLLSDVIKNGAYLININAELICEG